LNVALLARPASLPYRLYVAFSVLVHFPCSSVAAHTIVDEEAVRHVAQLVIFENMSVDFPTGRIGKKVVLGAA
jgi:hypothetical protein